MAHLGEFSIKNCNNIFNLDVNLVVFNINVCYVLDMILSKVYFFFVNFTARSSREKLKKYEPIILCIIQN
jgi:hypothetical protein